MAYNFDTAVIRTCFVNVLNPRPKALANYQQNQRPPCFHLCFLKDHPPFPYWTPITCSLHLPVTVHLCCDPASGCGWLFCEADTRSQGICRLLDSDDSLPPKNLLSKFSTDVMSVRSEFSINSLWPQNPNCRQLIWLFCQAWRKMIRTTATENQPCHWITLCVFWNHVSVVTMNYVQVSLSFYNWVVSRLLPIFIINIKRKSLRNEKGISNEMTKTRFTQVRELAFVQFLFNE